MALMTKSAAETLLQSVNFQIDWSKVNWKNVFMILQALLALFVQQPSTPVGPTPVAHTSKGCGPDGCQCLKAHFDCIQCIAACGSQCCDCQQPC